MSAVWVTWGVIASDDNGPSVADWAQVAIAVAVALIAAAIPLSAYLRRPAVYLSEKGARLESHVEASEIPYVRLLVGAKRWHRTAKGTRVTVVAYRQRRASTWTSLAHPALGWPSIQAPEAAVTLHAGTRRPVGLGRFQAPRKNRFGLLERDSQGNVTHTPWKDGCEWHLLLELHGLNILDDRDKLPPGEWVIRLLVGADDGDATAYDVHIAWSPDRGNHPREVLNEALDRLELLAADPGEILPHG